MKRILPLLNKLLPPGLAFKGLQKLDPKIGRFLTSATAAGYGTNETLNFMRDMFTPNQEQTDPGAPLFKQAEQRNVSEQRNISNKLNTAIGTGVGLAAGGSTLQAGGSLLSGMMGGSSEEQQTPRKPLALPSPQDPIGSEEQETPPSPEEPPVQEVFDITSIEDLESVSPELAKYVQHWLSKGMIPETIAKSMGETLLMPRVQELEQSTGKSFLEILKGISGNRKKRGEASERIMSRENLQLTDSAPSPGEQKLLQALNRLAELRGNR